MRDKVSNFLGTSLIQISNIPLNTMLENEQMNRKIICEKSNLDTEKETNYSIDNTQPHPHHPRNFAHAWNQSPIATNHFSSFDSPQNPLSDSSWNLQSWNTKTWCLRLKHRSTAYEQARWLPIAGVRRWDEFKYEDICARYKDSLKKHIAFNDPTSLISRGNLDQILREDIVVTLVTINNLLPVSNAFYEMNKRLHYAPSSKFSDSSQMELWVIMAHKSRCGTGHRVGAKAVVGSWFWLIRLK